MKYGSGSDESEKVEWKWRLLFSGRAASTLGYKGRLELRNKMFKPFVIFQSMDIWHRVWYIFCENVKIKTVPGYRWLIWWEILANIIERKLSQTVQNCTFLRGMNVKKHFWSSINSKWNSPAIEKQQVDGFPFFHVISIIIIMSWCSS